MILAHAGHWTVFLPVVPFILWMLVAAWRNARSSPSGDEDHSRG